MDQDLTSIFTIQRQNGTLITIKDSFLNYYRNRTPRYPITQEKECNIQFHECAENAIFIAQQFKKYKEDILHRLQDFSQYQDEVKTNFENTTDNTNNMNSNQRINNTHTIDTKSANLMAVSDAATMSTMRDKTQKYIETNKALAPDKSKYMDILDPNAKNVTHTVNINKGTETTDNNTNYNSNSVLKNANKGKSEVTSSNPFKDMITFLNIDIPSFRNKFLSEFRILFFT